MVLRHVMWFSAHVISCPVVSVEVPPVFGEPDCFSRSECLRCCLDTLDSIEQRSGTHSCSAYDLILNNSDVLALYLHWWVVAILICNQYSVETAAHRKSTIYPVLFSVIIFYRIHGLQIQLSPSIENNHQFIGSEVQTTSVRSSGLYHYCNCLK